MLYLVLAILCSALISVVMRLSTRKVKANISMLAVNYLVCLLLAGVHTGLPTLFSPSEGLPASLGMGCINGFLFLAGFVLLQSNMKTNGVVLSSIFMKLGLLVPIVLSVFLFGELPTVLQIIGFCMAVGAIVLINYEKNSKNSKSSKGSKVRKISKNSKSTVSRWSLVILLLAGGSCDAMAKVFEEWGPVGMGDPFLFYTFAIALLLSVALATWKNERPGKWEWLFGVVIAVPNFYSAKFLLMSLGSVPGVIAYPTYSVATILLVTLAGVFIFREKLKKRHWIAFAIILGALILLNI